LGTEISNLKYPGFAGPIQKQSLLLLFFIFFLLDQKERKNQENSIGLCQDFYSSANFLPPRAGKMSAINKGLICDR
jgi:hypothetical protein